MSPSQIGLILLVACVVAIASRRLRLPYSVGLVIAGVGLAISGAAFNLSLTPELIYSVLLPPLIFEAALQLKWRPFRDALPVTLTLAFLGVAIAATVVAAGMHILVGWGWLGAGLFGVLIAATDPVSVVAAFREMRVQPRLAMLVEAESLLNDGAAAVGFAVLVSVAQGGALSVPGVAEALAWKVLGGAAVGGGCAALALALAGRTDDHLVEITLTTIAAYGSFLLAEHVHMSGVLAAVAAGLVVGNVGPRGAIAAATHDPLESFWEYAAFLANSVVFILIGAHEASEAGRLLTVAAGLAVVLVLAGRVAAIYPLCALFARTRFRVDLRHQHVLVWGGLKGALALALSLAIPDAVPEKGSIILAAFAVVAFSIFAQGLTMPWLIRRLGLTRPADAAV
jgi:CPA1 family monovalent cation:H+ antiporter